MSDLSDFFELMEDGGSSEAETVAILKQDPTVVGRLGPQLEAFRAHKVELAEQKRQAAHARSPEGRREAMQQAQEAADRRKADAAGARNLLVVEGRLSAEDAEALTDQEALHVSGVEPNEALRSQAERDAVALADPDAERRAEFTDFRNRYQTMTHDERRERAEELGVGLAEVESAVRAVGLMFASSLGDSDGEGGGSE